MSVHPGTFTVFVFLPSLHATINTSSFNQEFCKPYNWTWDEHTKDFDNIPQLPCPLTLRRCVCKSDWRKSRYLVDCSFAKLLPSEIHQIPHNATHFGARKNGFNFTSITNGSFGNMTHLVYMDLSWNSLKTIGGDAFAAFNKLSVLDVSHNLLHTPAVFLRPLSSLQALNLGFQEYGN